ncbi:MAG: alpha-mannosidase [Thermosynechococcus sp.]|uniref:alpha-mannosidase n=1 Tax=Thermosynechococcus sp. TaxID=2814275 RepID=UPI0022086587|nr:glycoside hydrolase family 38 C-terminal domain-containing protein [Thermosynechococcus sp.]BCX12595.1 MAG: alpha-mannosidase [Thermosynechococcus sp.]
MVLTELIKESRNYLHSLAVIEIHSQWLPLTSPSLQDAGTTPYAVNVKGHLAWPKGRHSLWLGQRIRVPAMVQGYSVAGLTLRLDLTWWADQATVYVNGQAMHQGDLFDHSVSLCLGEAVTPGQTWDVVLHLISPGHDDGALVRSCLRFESPLGIDPDFVATELHILEIFGETLNLEPLEPLLKEILESQGQRPILDPLLAEIHDSMLAIATPLREFTIHLCGHAHLDLAWLWPIAETWQVAQSTFQSVLGLKKRYPELTFSHSTPALYAHLQTHAPELFGQIQAAVAAGWWDVAAGLWVEPELNLINAESIARQILYGQQYVQRVFGDISPIAWLPDTFGFPERLPSFLAQGGIRYFVTQKLRWNDTSRFPHGWFVWRDVAGAQINALMSAPIGEGIDPVKMATYAQQWWQQTGSRRSLWLPGVGDHGGGPTAEMLERVRRWQHLGGIGPQWQWTTLRQYLEQLSQETPPTTQWQGELYLEFHRGCYTSHGDQKAAHDRAQRQLQEAERWCALAAMTTAFSYPREELKTCWQQLLFNQFHDILPGSSIPEVYAEVNLTWQQLLTTTETLLKAAQTALWASIDYGTPPVAGAIPVVIFNSGVGDRAGVVHIDLAQLPPAIPSWRVYCPRGDYDLPAQLNTPQGCLTFCTPEVPGIGYTLLWLCPRSRPDPLPTPPLGYVLENNYLHVEIDPATGEITNLYDKLNHRPCLGDRGNQLQFFRDQGQYWDAWNIDPNYGQHRLAGAILESIAWVTWHQLEQRLRVRWRFQSSWIQQEYVLQYQTPWLRIDTIIDWQEEHILLKAAFPLAISAEQITCETPGGVTVRPTLPNPHLSPHEQAKWEVPFLTWVDLSTPEYGVSLFSDGKHGLDAQANQLRLTLLRSPTWPDPTSDRGQHRFSYGVFPHSGSWRAAAVPQWAAQFDHPLRSAIGHGAAELFGHCTGTLPAHAHLLHWSEAGIQCLALKEAEDREGWQLRVADVVGEGGTLALHSTLIPWQVKGAQTLLEMSTDRGDQMTLEPWEVVTLRLEI